MAEEKFSGFGGSNLSLPAVPGNALKIQRNFMRQVIRRSWLLGPPNNRKNNRKI
jgi:hypothetical protein